MDITLDQLADLLDGLPDREKAGRSAAVLAATQRMAQRQRDAVPVRTGYIRDTIEVSGVDGTTFRLGRDLAAEAGPTTPLAPLVEFGTRHSGPQPFVFNAADEIAQQLADDLTGTVQL